MFSYTVSKGMLRAWVSAYRKYHFIQMNYVQIFIFSFVLIFPTRINPPLGSLRSYFYVWVDIVNIVKEWIFLSFDFSLPNFLDNLNLSTIFALHRNKMQQNKNDNHKWEKYQNKKRKKAKHLLVDSVTLINTQIKVKCKIKCLLHLCFEISGTKFYI